MEDRLKVVVVIVGVMVVSGCAGIFQRTDWSGAGGEIEQTFEQLATSIREGDVAGWERHLAHREWPPTNLEAWRKAIREGTIEKIKFHAVNVHGEGGTRTARTRWTLTIEGQRRYGRTAYQVEWKNGRWIINRELNLLDNLFFAEPNQDIGRKLETKRSS